MQYLGSIAIVQIQTRPMKEQTHGVWEYRSEPLCTVRSLRATPDGLFGETEQGGSIIDVHHLAHPQSRFRGDNRISFGFLHHYIAMRQRFGAHMRDGIGGENIVIDCARPESIADLEGGIIIRNRQRDEVHLCEVIPAPPCVEFSTFCLQSPAEPHEIKATLQYLSNGRRGYYAALKSGANVEFQIGDEVFLVQPCHWK